MNWSELRKTCKRQSDYIITLLFTNEIALFFTWILIRTRITPNQITVASLGSALASGACYACGWFVIGSLFLFLSHILDCTDGNLARAKEIFSPLGKWMDVFGDRTSELFVFFGAGFYFLTVEASHLWALLSLLNASLLLLYYYIVDISLALGISSSKQNLTSIKFKGVHVKWGLMEPVIYGFIVLTPFGLLKIQLILVFALILLGMAYQIFKRLSNAVRGV